MKPIILRQHEVIHLRDHGSVIAWRAVKPGCLMSGSDGAKRRVLHLPHDLEVLKGFLSQLQKDPCKRFCKFGQTGEQRWVKETFRFDGIDHSIALSQQDMSEGVYRADLIGDRMIDDCPWLPSTRMPRWASRFTVTLDVGVKRIQEVTEEEARASVTCSVFTGKPYCTNCSGHESLCHKMTLRQTIAKGDENYFTSNPSYFWKITCTLKKP